MNQMENFKVFKEFTEAMLELSADLYDETKLMLWAVVSPSGKEILTKVFKFTDEKRVKMIEMKEVAVQ